MEYLERLILIPTSCLELLLELALDEPYLQITQTSSTTTTTTEETTTGKTWRADRPIS